MSSSQERRRSPRKPINLSVKIEDTLGVAWSGTLDVSSEGISIRSGVPRDIGTKLKLTLEIPGEKPLSCQGEVMSVGRGEDVGMGIRFVNLPAAEQARLDAFVGAVRADVKPAR